MIMAAIPDNERNVWRYTKKGVTGGVASAGGTSKLKD